MVLSNQTVATLNKFAIVARRGIALVKANDIIDDPRYAYSLFLQALFSDDQELISVTKKLSGELNIGNKIIEATEAYIHRLESEGKPETLIESNKYGLITLADFLYGIEANGDAYRDAVDAFLGTVSDEEKQFSIDLARAFFPYWQNALHEQIDTKPSGELAVDEQSKPFIALWNSIDDEFFSIEAEKKLSEYENAMQELNVSQKEIDSRIKMAKIIVVKHRKYSQEKENYRKVTNEIKTLFSSAEMKEYFLIVSREFYRFWTEA